MRVTSGSDWRDTIPFETPVGLADVAPGDPTRCALCGPASFLVSRDQLWAVKHRHPNDHSGFVRFYCDLHVPATAPVVVAAAPARAKRASSPRAPRAPKTARPTPFAERPRPVCPNCFMEVPPTGICGSCGAEVS